MDVGDKAELLALLGRSIELTARVPNAGSNIFVSEFIKDAITANSYKVVVLINLESFDLGSSNHDIWVAPSEGHLGFGVPESAANRQPARQHSNRANYVVGVLVLPLRLLGLSCGCSLVNLASSLYNSLVLLFFTGFMVLS